MNNYIEDIQKSTMLSYPITIDAQSIDLNSLMEAGRESTVSHEVQHGLDAVYSDGTTPVSYTHLLQNTDFHGITPPAFLRIADWSCKININRS